MLKLENYEKSLISEMSVFDHSIPILYSWCVKLCLMGGEQIANLKNSFFCHWNDKFSENFLLMCPSMSNVRNLFRIKNHFCIYMAFLIFLFIFLAIIVCFYAGDAGFHVLTAK